MRFLAPALRSVRNRWVAKRRAEAARNYCLQHAAPVQVTFYHRVADSDLTPWTISNQDFQRHLDFFQANLRCIDLAAAQSRVEGKRSSDMAISVTFDDGYRSNLDFAIPSLIERKIPCTYFVTTAHVREQKPFAHDLAVGARLEVNTVAEIREMANAGIEIGCHTRNHVDFSKVHDPNELRSEIHDAKDELEQMTGRRARYFAIPFGMPAQLTEAAILEIDRAGFDGFCSAFGAYNLVGRDSFHIRRYHGDTDATRMTNWTSLDPRKIEHEPSITYQRAPCPSETCRRGSCLQAAPIPVSEPEPVMPEL